MVETQSIELSSNMEKVVHDLPDDITEEILSWLPAIPLLRFKSVSKAWCKLISDSRFIKKHLTRGAKLKIMFRVDSGESSTESRYATVDYDAFGEDVEMPAQTFNDMSWVYNSCHGLVLVAMNPFHASVYIWNPTTGQRHLLPKPPMELKLRSDFGYGLGYDFTTEDCKVLCYLSRENRSGLDWGLYKQCTKSCQRLNNNKYKRVYSEMRFLENALHMLVCRLTSSSDKPEVIILAFDLSNEEFREIPLPNHGDKDLLIDIDASHSCLCLVSHLDSPVINVWVMKVYGNHESWTKIFSINREVFTETPELLHLSESGEILGCTSRRFPDSDNSLVLYNSKKKSWKTLKPVITGLDVIETHIYVESLVTFDIGDSPDEENRGRKRRSTKDIGDSPDEENRGRKRRNTKERCFEVVNSSIL